MEIRPLRGSVSKTRKTYAKAYSGTVKAVSPTLRRKKNRLFCLNYRSPF